jgi:hypothetical protein
VWTRRARNHVETAEDGHELRFVALDAARVLECARLRGARRALGFAHFVHFVAPRVVSFVQLRGDPHRALRATSWRPTSCTSCNFVAVRIVNFVALGLIGEDVT